MKPLYQAATSLLFLVPGVFTCAFSQANASLSYTIASGSICENVLPDTLIEGILCFGSSTDLEVGDQFDAYIWSTGDTTSHITVSAPGFYGITVTYQDTCMDSAMFDLSFQDQIVWISGQFLVCPGESAYLSASSGFVSYLWSTGETFSEILVYEPGVYSVTATDQYGCQSEDSFVVEGDFVISSIDLPVVCAEAGEPLPEIECGPGLLCYWTDEYGVPIDTIWETSTICVPTYTWCGEMILECTTAIVPDELQITGPSIICPGDTVMLCMPETYDRYHWGLGQTTRCISVTAGGYYCAYAYDTNGCESFACYSLDEYADFTFLETTILPDSGNADGSILVTLDRPPAEISPDWEFLDSTTIGLSGLAWGTYILQLTDEHDCTFRYEFVVDLASRVLDILHVKDLIRVSPNPSGSDWEIRKTTQADQRELTIVLHSVDGQSLFTERMGKDPMMIPCSTFAPGVYFLQVFDFGQFIGTYPLVKQ